MSIIERFPRVMREMRPVTQTIEAVAVSHPVRVDDLEDKAQAVERTRQAMKDAIKAHDDAVAAFSAELKERGLCLRP